MRRTLQVVAALGVGLGMLTACGSGGGPSDVLLTLVAGQTWVYRVAGTLTLPASAGGGQQTLRDAESTLTVEVTADTANDLAGNPARLVERKFHMVPLDGRVFDTSMRVYVSQTDSGIYFHGFHNFAGAVSGTPTWVPNSTSVPGRFLYLTNPAIDGRSGTYANPFGTTPAGNYSFTVWGPREQIQVAGETYSAKRLQIVEAFNNLSIEPAGIFDAGFSPEHGLLRGAITVKLPDGATLNGTIELVSR